MVISFFRDIKPSLSCPGLFLWTLESFQSYCMEEITLNILQRLYILRQNCQKWTILWMKYKSTRSETRQKSFVSILMFVFKDSRNLFLPSVVIRGERERPWVRGCVQITCANFNRIKIASYACAYVDVDFLLTL